MLGICQQAEATGPVRRTFTVKQSDGTTLQVQKQGNGRFSYYTTTDGWTLLRDAGGDFRYARQVGGGLQMLDRTAHSPEMRGEEEQRWVADSALASDRAYRWMEARFAPVRQQARGAESHDGIRPLGVSGDGVVRSIGAPVIPVIMVEFPDLPFMEGTSAEKVERMLSEPGYHDEKFCKGSASDYFKSQSNGLFTPTFKVVERVKAAHPYAYYGGNFENGAIDRNVRSLVREALEQAAGAGVDFTPFAADGGRVPLVSIYYAGPGEHSAFEAGSEDYIWAHFSESRFTIGGVGFNSYFVGNEVVQDYRYDEEVGGPVVTSRNIDGIGVFVHEFGHALGLPDFYKTGGGAAIDTPDYWSIMDYGQYCYNGYAPIGYSAFERASLGWLEVRDLTEPQYAELYPFGRESEGPTAYRLVNEAQPHEYFFLENRQSGTWYPAPMGQGLLITHVDYSATVWRSNQVNNDAHHQRYQIVPADGEKNNYDGGDKIVWDKVKADLFPGLLGVTEFSDESTPAATVFTGGKLGKPLYHIKEEGGIVSFSFGDKNLTGLEEVAAGAAGGGARLYTLSGRRVMSGDRLHPGVYLRLQDGRVQKVYVR